jgi:hypothetical protein
MVTWRKPVFFAMVYIFLLSLSTAAMPPAPNYCEHMGYNYTHIENGSQSEGICRFSANSSCPAGEFLNGKCGQEHVEEISCREEGDPVFTEFESCCGDLEPYLPPGASGQPTCQPDRSFFQKFSSTLDFLAMMAGEIILG